MNGKTNEVNWTNLSESTNPVKGRTATFFTKFDKIQVTSKTEIEILEWTVSNEM